MADRHDLGQLFGEVATDIDDAEHRLGQMVVENATDQVVIEQRLAQMVIEVARPATVPAYEYPEYVVVCINT